MPFLKNVLSSCLGALLAFIAMFFLTFIFFAAMIASFSSGFSDDKVETLKNNSVLHLKLDAQYAEVVAENPLDGLPVLGGGVKKIGLLELKDAIRHAKDDEKIKGIYLEVRHPMTSYSTIDEIRNSLIEFKQSGKWIVSYSEVMSEGAYYLATAADKIYLNPEGEIEFDGLTAGFVSFKKLFDKLEIVPQVFRVGEFKSAVEPFLMEKMSPENRLQLQELINSIYEHNLQRISEARNIDIKKLRGIADNVTVRSAKDALNERLIDTLYYKDEFINDLRRRLDLEEKDKLNLVEYTKYSKSYQSKNDSKNEIAVIVAEGTIMPGHNENESESIIAAETFVEEIAKARKDDDVKAIVLRVNSPGGEFRSSDMIWHEITLASKVKPVIASMSDYAASGGYYIAMACDTIVAQPNTITGSIGIFGVLFDLSSFLDHKLGITFDEVRTGNFGEMYTVSRPLTQVEKNLFQRELEKHYRTFVHHAAEGRNVSDEEILNVAGGRVWTGSQAKEHKLVDVLGGFDDAVKIAAQKADIADSYKLKFYPKRKTFIEQIVSGFEENARTNSIKAELGENYVWYERWKNVQNYHGAQARLPFELTIQ